MNELQNYETDDVAFARIRKVFADSSEVIAAFIGYARGNETPPASLIHEADKIFATLIDYRIRKRNYSTGLN